jgi:hypothetical protein
MNANTTYAKQVADLASAIQEKAQEILTMEKSRHNWTRPEGISIHMGQHIYVVPKSGVVPQQLAGIQQEVLTYHDNRLAMLRGELEGLRYKLIKLGREGGAA